MNPILVDSLKGGNENGPIISARQAEKTEKK